MALRRWKPFFPAFAAIDAAIEAATAGGCSRDKYRQARSELVEMLCDAVDDDVRAEGLCRLLDRAMAEALLTLRAVPVPAMPGMVVATGVAKAVDDLRKHQAGMVRALACGVLAQWKASVEAEIVSTEAQDAALDTLLKMLREHEVAATPATGGRVVRGGSETKTTVVHADSKQAAKISDQCPAKKEQTGDAKRKHPGPGAGGCCREADDVKRQRKVPETVVEHRPRKMEPFMKRSTDERRFSTSTRHRRV